MSQDYLGESAAHELGLRAMRGSTFSKFKRSHFRKMKVIDVIDPRMTWGELEDEIAVVCEVRNGRA